MSAGVFGAAAELEPGVVGWSTKGIGGMGLSYSGRGVLGQSAMGGGVVGISDQSVGVQGYSGNSVGILGMTSNPASLAGAFFGNVAIAGNLVVGGTKSAAVRSPMDRDARSRTSGSRISVARSSRGAGAPS